MIEWLSQPWPWYISGPMIGFTVPLLLIIGNKQLGISSSLRHICSACLPTKIPHLNYDWKKYSWNLVFVSGLVVGGFMGEFLLNDHQAVTITDATKTILMSYGISQFSGLLPVELFNSELIFGTVGITFVMLGGFLVGFGTRYANGCTSGHSIMGLANLKISSLVATISFFSGGLIMTHFIFPHLIG